MASIPDPIEQYKKHQSLMEVSPPATTAGAAISKSSLPPWLATDFQSDDEYVVKEIDNIFAELTRIDNNISQNQVSIDDLKTETREILAALPKTVTAIVLMSIGLVAGFAILRLLPPSSIHEVRHHFLQNICPVPSSPV
jgi:hypothetical protein